MGLTFLRYASVPLIAALIGWITNVIAVRMLFRPRAPIRVLGITLHGLVPRRRREIAQKIAQTIERELISHEDIERILRGEETAATIKGHVEGEFDRALKKLAESYPMLQMVLQGGMADSIRAVVVGEVSKGIPGLVERIMERLQGELRFQDIVEKKIEQFDLDHLERIILEISARELQAIELLGGVLGFIIGLVQLGLLFLE